MKQVQLKLLLCLLLAIGVTGQYNPVGLWGINFNGQPVMSGWGGYSGMGPYGRFGQQSAIVPQFSADFGQANTVQQIVQPAITQQTKVTDTDGTIQQHSFFPSLSAVAATGNRGVREDVCYNIIDSVYPLFSTYCSVLPQTTFSLPNFFGHQTKQEANELFLSLRPTLYSGCFSYMRLFLCPLFFPPCNVEPILPCANFCRAIKNRCSNVDLSVINCDKLPEKSEFCPIIIGKNRLMYGADEFQRTSSYNKHSSQQTPSDDYFDSSSLNRLPSTSGSSSNEAVQTQTNIDSYYGGKSSDVGSDQSMNNMKPTQAPTVMSGTHDFSKMNTGSTMNQQWTSEDPSTASLSTGGHTRSTYNFIKPGSSSYDFNSITSAQDSSIDRGNYGASPYNTNSKFRSSYGNNEKYGGGLSDTDTTKSVGSSSYSGTDNTGGGSSNGDTIKSTVSSLFGNNNNYVSGSSDGSNTASVDSSLFNRNDNYGGESSFVDTSKTASSSLYGNNKNYGGESTSFGSSMKPVGLSSYGNGGESSYVDTKSSGSSSSSYGNNMIPGGSSSYGNNMIPGGSSSNGNNMMSGGSSSSYGNNMMPGGSSSSYGNTMMPGGSSSSYGNNMMPGGSSSYGNNMMPGASSSSYGNNMMPGGSSSYGNNMMPGGSSSYGNNMMPGASSSLYGNNMMPGGSSSSSSYGNNMMPGGSSSSYGNNMMPSGSSSSYGNNMMPGGSSSSYGNNMMPSGSSSSSYGNNMMPGGSSSSSYGNGMMPAGSTSYGSESSFGNSMKPSGLSSYGNGGASSSGDTTKPTESSSSYGNGMMPVGSTSYGGESLFGSSTKSTELSSPGNNDKYGGRSTAFGNDMKSVGSTSYGSSGSYDGSSYGKSGSYGATDAFELTGLPYGLQSTGEYLNYYPEKFDLSKCGPQPPKNPCTLNGPQYYPLPGYPYCYIQCAFEHMFVKPCPPELVWNALINVCDWPTAPYSTDDNSYGSSSYSNSNYQSGSPYSYGRKKRSTIGRKKLFRNGNPFPSLNKLDVPLGPSVPGVVPLPGFTGPIGIAGPLVPPPTPPPSPPSTAPVMVPPMVSRMFPSMFPLFAPMSLPMVPSQIAPSPMFPQSSTSQSMFLQSSFPQPMFPQPSAPQPMFPQPSAPQLMFPQPTVSQTIFPQATVSQLMFPQRTMSQAMFPQPTVSQPMSPPSPMAQPTFLTFPTFPTFPTSPTPPSTPSLPSFIPPILPSLPIPLDGPLLPPLPMSIPATFIPGPPPIFGAPWFGPFDEPSESGGASFGSMGTPSAPFSGSFGQPFGFKPSFGYPFGFDPGFGSGFPSASNFYSGLSQSFPFSNGYNRGSKNGHKKDFDNDDDDDDYDTYDDEKTSSSSDDDSDKSKPSKRSKNNNIATRKKREYDSNDHQDVTNEQQSSSESINQLLDQSSPCIGQTIKTNIPHPTDSTKYISCLNENKYEIMDCPTDFIYNALIDQCEKNKNMESICEQQQPCMNDGQCFQTSSTIYKCVCQGAWTGEHCETPLSSCASNPCGEGNECHTLITNDYKQDYICICNQQQSYGLTCAQNTIPNPCMSASNDEEQYYPFAFSASAYIQCDGDLLHVRPCATDLHWNQEKKICDREETLSMHPIEDQSQSYHINYDTQPSETIFNRPYVNFIDQIVDKQQGYRYRNYNPHTTSNDFRYNQIRLPEETSMIYSYFPSSSMIKENRRLKNQHGYTPINMHVVVEDQNPMFSDQQFSQSYNHLPKNSFMQLTPQRNMYRIFQSSSYRR